MAALAVAPGLATAAEAGASALADVERPRQFADLAAGPVHAAGTAVAAGGVRAVEVAVQDVDGGGWLRADGGFGARTWLRAAVAGRGERPPARGSPCRP